MAPMPLAKQVPTGETMGASSTNYCLEAVEAVSAVPLPIWLVLELPEPFLLDHDLAPQQRLWHASSLGRV